MQNDCLKTLKNYTEGSSYFPTKYRDGIHSAINTYALPSSQARPFGFFSDYYSSAYAYNDYWCASISSWDVEDKDSYFAKELFCFDFRIRCLVTAFQHKFNGLYLFDSNRNIEDLVHNVDESKIKMKARHNMPSDVVMDLKGNDTPRLRVHGIEGFREERLN